MSILDVNVCFVDVPEGWTHFFASIVLVCVFLLGALRLRDISEPYLLILIILLLCCVYLCCVFTSFDLLVRDSLCASWVWLTTLGRSFAFSAFYGRIAGL